MLKRDSPRRRRHPCPRCGRSLQQDGEMIVRLGPVETSLPFFSCDECRTAITLAGETMELPFTFVVDAQGRAFDPAAGDEA